MALADDIVAVAGALFGAGLSAFVTFRVTKRTVEANAEGSREQRRHERQMAHNERQQERMFNAYVAIERHISHWHRKIIWELETTQLYQNPEVLEPKDDTIDYSSSALANLVASHSVALALSEFNEKLHEHVFLKSMSWQLDIKWPDEEMAPIRRQHFDVLRRTGEEVIRSAHVLQELMRAELQSAQQPETPTGPGEAVG